MSAMALIAAWLLLGVAVAVALGRLIARAQHLIDEREDRFPIDH